MDPQVVSIAEARAMTRLGNTTLYKLIGEGVLATCKIGRRRLVKVESIRQLIADASQAA